MLLVLLCILLSFSYRRSMPKENRFKWRKPKPVKNQQPPEHKTNEGDKEPRDIPQSGSRVVVDFSHHLKTKHETERDEDAARENKHLRWTQIAAALVFAYTLVMVWQSCMTRESIDNNTRQFHIDQRPYLWDTEMHPKIAIESGQRMWANIPMANFGKSPALKSTIVGKIFIGPTAYKDADEWFAAMADKPIGDPQQGGIVVPPGIPTPYQPQPSDSMPREPTSKQTGIRGGFGGMFFTIMSDKVLTQPDVDYILNTDESAVMVIRLQYFDGFGIRYWSDLCL
ncbi:MAG TPA: hypothetical protein VMD76_09405, partial [Candidatus Sulfotelmatobacter sp.]|nr:hypothetical protein [Candidatus Sulfotelmatobacter sp.]